MNIEQQRTRRVGGIGRMYAPARQAPQQKRIDRAEGEFACLGAGTHAIDMVKKPCNLGTREIRVEPEPGLFRNRSLQAIRQPAGQRRQRFWATRSPTESTA